MPEVGGDAFFEGGADGGEVVVGGGKLFVAVGEEVVGAGIGEPEQAVDGAVGADGGDVEGRIVGVLDDEAQLRDALLGEGHGEAVGGEAGQVDAGDDAVGDGAPAVAAVDHGRHLDGGDTVEVAGGGFEVEAGERRAAGVEGDFRGVGVAVLADLQAGMGPFLEDGVVIGEDRGFLPEFHAGDAEGGLKEVGGDALVLAVGLDEMDERLGALLGGVVDFDGEMAAVVGRQGDVRAAEIHEAGVVEDFGLGERVPELAVIAAGDADAADEVLERRVDGEAGGGGRIGGQVEAGVDAVAGEFAEFGGLGEDGGAGDALPGGEQRLDGAGRFIAVGQVEEAEVGEVRAGVGADGGIEAEFGEVRGFIVDREERAGGAEVGRDGGASRGSGEQQDGRECAFHDQAPLAGKYPISGGESPMFKCGAAHSGGAWKRARARR